jgi:hypothetical protein
MLVLFSAILLFWEYVGIQLHQGTAATEAELPFKTKITILNPEAIPVVLSLAVIYFLVRFFIELYQCDETLRAARPARIDKWLSLGISAAALIVFAVQNATKYRLAELISTEVYLVSGIVVFGLGNAMITGTAWGHDLGWRGIQKKYYSEEPVNYVTLGFWRAIRILSVVGTVLFAWRITSDEQFALTLAAGMIICSVYFYISEKQRVAEGFKPPIEVDENGNLK